MSDDSHLEPEPANTSELDVALAARSGVVVELSTAAGCVFLGTVSTVHVRMIEGGVDISSPQETYLNLSKVTEIDLLSGSHFETFRVENALASFRDGKLTVVASAIFPRYGGIAG